MTHVYVEGIAPGCNHVSKCGSLDPEPHIDPDDALRAQAIAENHAILTLTGLPREGYTLQQEIRAQLEESQADVERLRGLLVRMRDALASEHYYPCPTFDGPCDWRELLREIDAELGEGGKP